MIPSTSFYSRGVCLENSNKDFNSQSDEDGYDSDEDESYNPGFNFL